MEDRGVRIFEIRFDSLLAAKSTSGCLAVGDDIDVDGPPFSDAVDRGCFYGFFERFYGSGVYRTVSCPFQKRKIFKNGLG